MSKEKPSDKKKQPEKAKKVKRLINFLLSSKQEEMLDYNIKTLNLAKNRTDYFVNKITEDFKTQGKGYKKEIPNGVASEEYVDESNENLFQRLQKEIQNIEIFSQSLLDREETLGKEQKLAKIEQHLFSYSGLAKLDTYDKLEGYLVQQFPEWESDLVGKKIYYELIPKFLESGDIKYNKRLKTLVWSVPEK